MQVDELSAEQRHLQNLESVAHNNDPNTRGQAEIIMIKDGTESILGYPPDEARVSIAWREGPILIIVNGPTLNRAQAVAIAEQL
jgi:hypothetical protein